MNINFLLHSLYLFEDKSMKNDKKIEYFQFMDVLIDRVREAKYKEKIELKIKSLKIVFRFLPKGGSLGASMINLKLDQLKLCYLVDYSVQDEVHIQGIFHKVLQKQEYDFLITNLVSREVQRFSLKEALLQTIKQNQKVVLLIDQIPRIFEVILVLNEFLMNEEVLSATIILPKIYGYYIDVMKRLSEYMPREISQNLTIGEDDLFTLKFLKYDQKVNRSNQEKDIKIFISCVSDFVLGNIFKDQEYFKSFQLVFLNKDAQKVYLKYLASSVDDKNLENNDVSASHVHKFQNKLIGSLESEDKIDFYDPKSDKLNLNLTDDELQTKLPSANNEFSQKEEIIASNLNYYGVDKHELFFTFKNHDVCFYFPKMERTKNDYGNPLNEFEMSVMELIDPGHSFENENDQVAKSMQQDMTKSKEFFEDYLELTYQNTINVPKFQGEVILYQEWAASSKDQVILISQISAKRVVLINKTEFFMEEFLKNYCRQMDKNPEIITLDHHHSFSTSQQILSVNFHAKELENLQFKTISEDVKQTRINFTLHKSGSSKFELSITQLANNSLYQIQKGVNLLKIKNFIQKKGGFALKLEVRRLNYQNKVFIQNQNDQFVIEGVFCEEYFKIRELFYQLINL